MRERQQYNIAVVEDDPQCRELVVEYLEHLGYGVTLYGNGEDFLQDIDDNFPDLVLLDVMLAGIDGFEVCRKIKQKHGAELPVIILTVLDDEVSRKRGLKAGCDEFLTKPIEFTELKIRIANLLRMGRLTRQLGSREKVALNLCDKQETEAEKELIRVLLVEDHTHDRELISAYLSGDKYELTPCSTGQEALEQIDDSFDIILLDYFLPRMTGIDFYKKVKNRDLEIPVIMITINDDTDTRTRSIEAGVDDYLCKPVDRMELIARINYLLEIYRKQENLRGAYTRAVDKASRDSLTGLYNNSFFKEFLREEIDRSEKYNKELSLIMMDLDDFKEYNDTNGHVEGDRALEKTAAIIKNNIRNSDLAARYGGEEFAVVFPDTGEQEARVIARRLRQKIADYNYPGQEKMSGSGGNLTVSIGLAIYDGQMTAPRLINLSDRALYRAKNRGKNIVCRGRDVGNVCQDNGN